MTPRNAKLHERDQSPVGAGPLLVRMPAEAAAGFLSAEHRADDRPGENRLIIEFDRFPKNISTSQIPHGRFVGREQPVERVVGFGQLASCLCHRISAA